MWIFVILAIVFIAILAAIRPKRKPEKSLMCDICGKSEFESQVHKANDGTICKNCYIAAGFPASIPITLMPLSLVREQINSTDGISIVKRFKNAGGQDPKPYIASSPSAVRCSKCGSESISADKKGFGVGKAAVGAVLVGPIGLAAGGIGSKDVRITCLNCGNQWIAGERK